MNKNKQGNSLTHNAALSNSGSQDALSRLIVGYEAFKARYFSQERESLVYEKLVQEGQNPEVMLIACSDSRVDPSILLGALPGELFVVRNVANIVPPCDNDPRHHGTSAALEFAVEHLKVQHIILLGHSHCGGIAALLNTSSCHIADQQNQSFIGSWMRIASAAKIKTESACEGQPFLERAKFCEEQSLLISLNNLETFPWIRARVAVGKLQLHAWRFDLSTGIIQRFDGASKQFEPLV